MDLLVVADAVYGAHRLPNVGAFLVYSEKVTRPGECLQSGHKEGAAPAGWLDDGRRGETGSLYYCADIASETPRGLEVAELDLSVFVSCHRYLSLITPGTVPAWSITRRY